MEIEETFPVTFRKCFMFLFFLTITSGIPALKSQTFFRNTFLFFGQLGRNGRDN